MNNYHFMYFEITKKSPTYNKKHPPACKHEVLKARQWVGYMDCYKMQGVNFHLSIKIKGL